MFKEGHMKHLILALALALPMLGGCAVYSERGTGEGQGSSKVGKISCDATPANQPGCYQKSSPDWKFGNFRFGLGV
jgi:hypothetical protein